MSFNVNDYILYHPSLAPRLADYGFDIPLACERSDQVFDHLKEDFPELHYTGEEDLCSLVKEDLLLAHDKAFVESLFCEESARKEFLRVYQSERALMKVGANDFLASILKQAGGTFLCMKKSLATKFCFFLGGGMHHASFAQGDGFCPINDIVIGIKKLQASGAIKNALVVDIDAHKGDGTAHITQDDESIFTVSIHMQNGWPQAWETPGADCASDIDIEIAAGEEAFYCDRLQKELSGLIHRRSFDLAVVVCGADPYEHDELDSASLLKLTKEQMLLRDIIVQKMLKDIPQAWLMAGGYGDKSFEIYYQFLSTFLLGKREG